MPHKFVLRIERELEGRASFVDATDIVDRIKAIKSEEEQDLIRKCAQMQDEVFKRVVEKIRPGMTTRLKTSSCICAHLRMRSCSSSLLIALMRSTMSVASTKLARPSSSRSMRSTNLCGIAPAAIQPIVRYPCRLRSSATSSAWYSSV